MVPVLNWASGFEFDLWGCGSSAVDDWSACWRRLVDW